MGRALDLCERPIALAASDRSVDGPAVYTANEVARLLGLNPKTVRAAASRGEIPARRVGRRLIFPRCAIDAWLAEVPATIESPTSRRRRKATR